MHIKPKCVMNFTTVGLLFVCRRHCVLYALFLIFKCIIIISVNNNVIMGFKNVDIILEASYRGANG